MIDNPIDERMSIPISHNRACLEWNTIKIGNQKNHNGTKQSSLEKREPLASLNKRIREY